MQVFEFHFNPPYKNRLASGKEDLIFDSFCFEPKNVYEKRMGGLYMTGLLDNVLPQNIRFLEILAEKIKEKYYKAVSSVPEKSLGDALRIANEHLEKIAKQGDVSWLGNLSFSVISLKNSELNFTKIGDFKILLIRKGQIIDIDQRLKFNEIEPYPLKIFGNIVSGKLTENDVIVVLSGEVYDAFLKENLLNEIARKSSAESSREGVKKFGSVLNSKKEQLAKISGICLLMVLSKEETAKERETLTKEKTLKIFSLKEIFNPFVKIIKKIRVPKISLKLKIPKPKISIPKIGLPKPKLRISYRFSSKLKRNLILVLVLILILAMGFFIFEKKEERNAKTYQIQIDQIQEKINLADSYFVLAEYNPQAKKNANVLYKEVWNELSPLFDISSKLPGTIAGQVSELKNAALEKLYQLNKLAEISEPELVFEFKAKEFIPLKLISFKDNVYFFSQFSENIFELNVKEKTGKIIEINQKIAKATLFPESVLFFSEPNQIIALKEGQFQEPKHLQEPYDNFDFTGFSSYRLNLYFLDDKNGKIVKYPFVSELNWGTPESWLAPEIKTATDFKSMAVDGSIWILTKKNAVERYHIGQLQKTITLEIFPEPKNFSKIFTSLQLPYLYFLEQEQKRLIILDKNGQIVKQYQSEKFDNLLDFSVSEDGKTIYLLNGLKVYKITAQRR